MDEHVLVHTQTWRSRRREAPRPDGPYLVHCTVGNDRSSMLAASILAVCTLLCPSLHTRELTCRYTFIQLLGACEEDVPADYELTIVSPRPSCISSRASRKRLLAGTAKYGEFLPALVFCLHIAHPTSRTFHIPSESRQVAPGCARGGAG